MLDYKIITSPTGTKHLETSLSGKALLSIPALNKGTAFSEQEREEFGLLGKLPDRVEVLEDQIRRAYQQYLSYDKLINRNRYLNRLLDNNQVLFYALIKKYPAEMLPIIYTPFVGSNVKLYNLRFMQPRGIYISYKNQDRIEEILDNRTNPNVQLIVVTDGEAILGIGDQGVGGMAIPVAKLIVYGLFGGIDPNTTLPIMLDVGTNNEEILQDPLYLGLRQRRIDAASYEIFMDKFFNALKKKFPNAFLHFEDFGRYNAAYYLKKYHQKICAFNDDIQGTGIVALATAMSASRKSGISLQQQRIVVFGAGSAGMGIVDSIYKELIASGLTESEAQQRFWIVDRPGLLTELTTELTESQKKFIRRSEEISAWAVDHKNHITLLEVIQHVKPTLLIGTSAQAGAFNQVIVTEMAKHVEHPTILPLSNPNENAEATPTDIIHWTDGRAFIATGSPFSQVEYNQRTYVIGQCNNYLAFPGLGLGILATKANHLSAGMLRAASHALADYAAAQCEGLLPGISQVEAASLQIAIAVAKAAVAEGLATLEIHQPIEELVEATKWQPEYLSYSRSKI